MAKAKKIDHSLQDEPIVLTNKLSEVKTPYYKQKEKKENKKARSKEIAVSHEIIDSQPVFVEEYYNVHTRQYHSATVKFVELQCVNIVIPPFIRWPPNSPMVSIALKDFFTNSMQSFLRLFLASVTSPL